MSDRIRTLIETVGAGLIVVGVAGWSVSAALVVAGLCLVAAGNAGRS